MPVMAQRPDRIEARHYNIWRRARRRWGSPIRIALPGLTGMEMVLADAWWVCLDRTRHDVPVLAWVEMQDTPRTTLHLDIPCKLNYYHFAASAIRARSLALMEGILGERLRKRG